MLTYSRIREQPLTRKYRTIVPISAYKKVSNPDGSSCNKTTTDLVQPTRDVMVSESFASITDEDVILPANYADRMIFLASPEFKAWKLLFKPVTHVKRSYGNLITGHAEFYTALQEFPPCYFYVPWGIYINNEFTYFRGSMYPSYLTWYYGNIDPLRPVDHLFGMTEYISAIYMDNVRVANMIKNLTSDAKLLGTKTFSVANFLYEIKEVISLVGLFKIKTNSILKESSDKYLGYSFGVKPLIGDIKAIYDIVNNLHSRIQKWNEAIGNSPIYNTHVVVEKQTIDISGSYDSLPSGWFINNLSGKVDVTIRGHAYFKPDYIPPLDEAKIFLSLSGLGNPLSIIWEAIPYSFLVDWVVNVGDMIEAFEASDPIVQISAVTYGYSIKVKSQGGLYNHYVMQPGNVSTGGHVPHPSLPSDQGGTIYESYESYNRILIDPSTVTPITPFDVGEFTFKQSGDHIALAAALAVQRLK
jgi:hypothetical protein